MAVNIGDLKYQNPYRPLGDMFRNYGGIWNYIDVVDGFKNKATIADNHFLDSNFEPLTCADSFDDLKELNTRIAGREIKFRNYQIKAKVERCSTTGKWLEYMLKKGANKNDENEIFLEQLEDVMIGANAANIAHFLFDNLYIFASQDNDVHSVQLGTATDGAGNKLLDSAIGNEDFLLVKNSILDKSKPVLFVSTQYMEYLHAYYQNNQDGKEAKYTEDANDRDTKGLIIRGVEVYGMPFKMGGSDYHQAMFLTTWDNLIIFTDDEGDFSRVKVIPKEELSTDVISMAMNFAMNYKSSRKIIIGLKP